ncbi:hypothetical protein [Streptomyces sp. NPDC051561]|uniref:hypothetical protein n=1 Tax=Streptomyces sp. NPDC051561 TaxID=3365658 RepID=UPI0037BDA6DA
MSELTLTGLYAPLRTLSLLESEFPGLPAPDVHISRFYPGRVELAFHDDLGAFEAWRAALHVPADTVRFGAQGVDNSTMRLRAEGPYGACTISLVAYAPAPSTLSATEVAA